MSRPLTPPLTPEEHAATSHLGLRLAADAVSRLRGAATYPNRRVSHEWLRRQRQQTPTVKKPESAAAPLLDAQPSRNEPSREVGEPVPHQESPLACRNRPAGLAGVQEKANPDSVVIDGNETSPSNSGAEPLAFSVPDSEPVRKLEVAK